MGFFYNLDEETKEFAKKRTCFCLVIYDIISNKRRLKLSKLLEGYGVRVQRSCFEITLEKSHYSQLLSDLEEFYNPKECDNIIVYIGHKEERVIFRAEGDTSELLEDILFL